MATYYVDKRTGLDTNNGSSSTPWKSLTNPGLSAKVAAGGTHTIEIAPNSGPYYPPDAMALSVGYVYHQQTSGLITWNWNKNAYQCDWNVNDGSYKWTKSNASGKTNWYYLTALDNTAPQQSSLVTVGVVGAITECFTVIIGDDWNEKSTNLVNGAPNPGTPNNWAWGNYDSLSFSTLYVKMANGLSPSDPTNASTEIMVTNNNGYIVRLDSLPTVHNDIVVRGCNDSISSRALIILGKQTTLNRPVLINSRFNGIDFNNTTGGNGSVINHPVFKQCGHRGIQFSQQAGATLNAPIFDRVHLAIKFLSDTAYTVALYNAVSKNLYAGAVQKDVATPTFTETNNQWHIDPLSNHGDKAIAFTTGTRRWTQTASTDLPASTSTALTTSVDPLLTSDYHLQPTSPCIGAGAAIAGITTDIEGNQLYPPYNIGPYGAAGALDRTQPTTRTKDAKIKKYLKVPA